MARILLYGFDGETAGAFCDLLHTHRHQVSICSDRTSFQQTLYMRGIGIDLVILRPTTENCFCSEQLQSITVCRANNGGKPMVLCVLDDYQGPQVELELECKGARVTYVG